MTDCNKCDDMACAEHATEAAAEMREFIDRCKIAPAEKPDDVVERCAQAQAYPQYHTDWNCLRDGQKNFLRNHAKAVLEAAGVERLRGELRDAQDIAERARREERELRDEVHAAFRKHNLAAGPRAIDALVERAGKAEKECERLRAESTRSALMTGLWEGRARKLEIAARVVIDDIDRGRHTQGAELRSVLHHHFDKTPGEPAATVAADSSGSAPQAEKTVTAGSSSLSDDDARTVALMVQQVQLAYAAAKRRVEPLDAMLNPAESEPSIIRSGFELLERVRLVKKTL